MLKQIAFFSALCSSLVQVAALDVPEYRIAEWQELDRGKHRVVVNVDSDNANYDAVRVVIPWRRRDFEPEKKQILVYAENSGRAVTNVIVLENKREYGDIIFAPVDGAGRYFVYYLPYKEPTYYFGDPGEYYPAKDTFDPAWRQSLEKIGNASVEAIEAFSQFDSMYPMEVPATVAEMEDFLARSGGTGIMLFPESREFPIRMFDELPVHWLRRGAGTLFRGSARPNEFFVFQIGVYAAGDALNDIELVISDLQNGAERIPSQLFECINLTGTDPYGKPAAPVTAVAANTVQPLWIICHVPADAAPGVYSGEAAVYAAGGLSASVPLEIEVGGDVLEDSGVSDLNSMARLAWLNSTAGLEPHVPPPYIPVEYQDGTVAILDRTITYSASGLPSSVTSRGRELLLEPVSFVVVRDGTTEKFVPVSEKIIEHNDSVLRRENILAGDSFRLTVTSETEFDGCIRVSMKLAALKNTSVDDAILSVIHPAAEVPYAMGLGMRGGRRPAARSWNWAEASAPSLWMGSTEAGMQIYLESDTVAAPPERWQEDPAPQAWYNNGIGWWEMAEENGCVGSFIHSGSRNIAAGEELDFHFRILVTPFKPVDPDHWNWRFQSQWGGSGDIGHTMALLFHGDSSCGNTYINYPFLEEDTMKAYIRNMFPDAAVASYPADGIASGASGKVTVKVSSRIRTAEAGPGMKGYPVWSFARPGGEYVALEWHPAGRKFALQLRNGFSGLVPQRTLLAEFPVHEWHPGEEYNVETVWHNGSVQVLVNGVQAASGAGFFIPGIDSPGQCRFNIINSPAFAVSKAEIAGENSQLLFEEDFRNIDGRNIIPVFAASGCTGKISGVAIQPGDSAPELVPDGTGKNVMPVLYYAARELSNHTAELWALRSLQEEVFHSKSLVYAVDGVQEAESGGGYPWLREHLRTGYSPAWRMPLGKFNDASLSLKISRWHNYYIEGMDYLMRECGVEGLYLDGVGYDRRILQRMVKVMKKRNPDAHVNVHYVDAYNQLGRMTSAAAMYMEFLPYVDSLWFGELFSYDLDPDYWLVELSGIPFGLSSEMLNYQNGGNPWRGMIYGMSSRMLPSANAMWNFWDESGIKDSVHYGFWSENCPVKTDRPDVRCSVYHCGNGKAVIALAHWPLPGSEEQEVVVPRALSEPSLAGEMTPQYWEEGAVVNSFNLVGTDAKVGGVWGTEVRLLRDDRYLYVGFQGCFTGELKMVNTERDGQIYSDDSVDLFFEDSRGNVIHYILNAAGGIWDARNGDTSWDSDIYYRTWVGKNIWDNQIWHGTLRIPLDVFAGEMYSLRFNACRTSFAPEQILSSWAKVQEYNDSAKWGRLLMRDGAVAREKIVEDTVSVNLKIDYAALGIDPANAELIQPEINYFQDAVARTPDAPVDFKNSCGAILILQEK